MVAPDELNDFYSEHISIVLSSYQRLVGRKIPLNGEFESCSEGAVAKALFNAPFALLSHDTARKPVFNYANRTAMRLFNMKWEEITALESHYSAEETTREQRSLLLNEVKARGYIEDYSGTRIAKGGRRFYIEQATVWNLIDADGRYYGQAAMFDRWRFFDVDNF